MMQPKRTKYRKQMKGRNRGLALNGNKVSFGEYGLKCSEWGRLTARQIEAARRVITRYVKKGGKMWIRVFPDAPVTKKPLEVRMGSGKGNVEYWVAKVQPGKMIYELEGVTDPEKKRKTIGRLFIDVFDAEAKKHPIEKVARVTTWTELVQALSSGLPVTIASNVGFQASARDADGFIAANGTWPHQMCIGGLRWATNAPPGTKHPRDGVLVLNSWGESWPPQAGGTFPADQPAGTFWITKADAERVLTAGDSWAYSTTANWQPVPIDHGQWFQPAPASVANSFTLAP